MSRFSYINLSKTSSFKLDIFQWLHVYYSREKNKRCKTAFHCQAKKTDCLVIKLHYVSWVHMICKD